MIPEPLPRSSTVSPGRTAASIAARNALVRSVAAKHRYTYSTSDDIFMLDSGNGIAVGGVTHANQRAGIVLRVLDHGTRQLREARKIVDKLEELWMALGVIVLDHFESKIVEE